MPSLLDPTLLRGQQSGDDPTGIQTLLGGIGSALSGGVAQPNDPNTTMASILAAGNALANAGAPTLGPPPTTAQAILGALGGARSAAVQTGILPYMQERAQQQLEQQNLDYQVKLFDFNRRINAANLLRGGVSAAADTTGGAPDVPPAARPAGSPPIIQRDPSVAVAGDQANNPGNLMYALQPDATGRLQLSGGRTLAAFPDMPTGIAANANQLMINQDQHGFNTVRGQVTQWVHDPSANLTGTDAKGNVIPNVAGTPAASGSYIGDVAKALGVDPDAPLDFHDAGVLSKYILAMRPHESGPAALDPHDVTAGVQLALNPAKRVQVADASGRTGGGGGPPAPPGAPAGAPGDPLVNVAGMPGLQVPRSVELAARSVAVSAADPYAAYSGVIKDYAEKRALAPHYAPGTVPGTQINATTGQVETATTGVTSLSPITPAERQSMFPQIPKWQDIVVTRDPTGRITDYKLPDMGPEPQIPISDADAQKPTEDGGAGGSYRPLTAFTRGARSGLVKPIQIERGAGIAGTDANPPGVVTPPQLQQQQQVFQQTQELENQVVHSPIYTQWAQGAQRFDAVLASLNQRTRVGDQAAIESLAKVFDPGAVVTEGKLQMASSYGGVAQQLQNALGKITGESGLPDDVRQQIVNLATAEMKTRDAAVLSQIARSRASAQAKGLNADNVLPLFQTTALSKGDAEARNAPKGVQLAPPVTLQNGQFVRGEPSQTSGATLPVPSASDFANMSGAGLSAIIADGQAHPERYSQDYRTALGAELQRRGGAR